MDVSVIIPVYNVENYISDCLHSVMNQTARCSIECIVVDDRGDDDSIEIAKRELAEYSGNIKFSIITREHNGGLSAARNTGIHAAKGDYLFFLDSDDTISDDCIERLYGLTRRYPGVEVVYGKTVCVPDPEVMKDYFDLRRVTDKEFVNDPTTAIDVSLLLPEVAWNRLIKRDWLIGNHLWFKEGIIHEDFHWHLRAHGLIRSCAALLDGAPTYRYLQRSGSIIERQNEAKTALGRAEIMLDVSRGDLLWNQTFQVYFLRCLAKMKPFASANPRLRQLSHEIIGNLLQKSNISARSKSVIRYLDSRLFNKYVFYLIRSIT